MKKSTAIIIIFCIIFLGLSGCSAKNIFSNGEKEVDSEYVKEIGQVESVEDLKKLNDKRYDNICKDLYDDEEILLSQDDDSLITVEDLARSKSRVNASFKYFRGYKTEAYFYRFRETTDKITFYYTGNIKKGRCKFIIISPSREIVSSVELNGEGAVDVPITEDGNYYVRLIGDDASGEIELDAKGADIVYKFTNGQFKGKNGAGLYDYE